MAFTYPIRFASQMREHLRSLRKKQGMTQAQLGARMGVSQARIAEIEANPGLVSFEQLLQILSHLDSGLALEIDIRPQPTTCGETHPQKTWPELAAPEESATVAADRAVPYTFTRKKGSW